MRCSTRHLPSRGASRRRGLPASSPAEGRFAPKPGRCSAGASESRLNIRALRRAVNRRGERGSAILETFLSMLLLMLILFGSLQVFQLILANMIADYAAFRGARSTSVGFNQQWSRIEAKIKAVPASGHIIIPDEENGTKSMPVSLSLNQEEKYLTKYQEQDEDYKNLNYTYWDGREGAYHTDYRCRLYGQPMTEDCDVCYVQDSKKPLVKAKDKYGGTGVKTHYVFEFRNYPLTVPLYHLLTGQDSVNIEQEAELNNHSFKFLR